MESTMSLFEGDRWMNRDVLKSMAEIQRHAGVTISRILEKAVVSHYANDLQYEGRNDLLYHSENVQWDSLSLGRTQWTCPDSPVLLCIYDVASHADPARDHCLFCESPDERK